MFVKLHASFSGCHYQKPSCIPKLRLPKKSEYTLCQSAKQDGFTYVQPNLPNAENTRIKTAVYVKSSVKVSECPPGKYPEFALIGRSNVGKSSLLNMITGQNGLAKVSKAPGLTKCINHYILNNNCYLVDLPGYGYAKTSKTMKADWIAFTQEYFVSRPRLAQVFLLIDSTVPTQAIDIECAHWLAECQVPFSIVFTKMDADRKGSGTQATNVNSFKAALAQSWEALPLCFETSSKTASGRTEILQFLGSMRDLEMQESSS